MVDEPRFIIYGLVDPRDGELRYVGLSTVGFKRPRSHWQNKNIRERNDHCHCWIRSVIADNFIPSIVVFQTFENSDIIRYAERFWIAYFRRMGCRLTNMNDGGEGQLNPSPEIRQRQREANIGNKNGVGHRYVMSEELKKKVGDRHRGKVESIETRLKKSLSHMGIPRTKEWLENQSRALKGKLRIARTSRQCHSCSTEVILRETDRRLKLKRIFCSLSCLGKFRRKFDDVTN